MSHDVDSWLNQLIEDHQLDDLPTYIITNQANTSALEQFILKRLFVNTHFIVLTPNKWLERLSKQGLNTVSPLTFLQCVSKMTSIHDLTVYGKQMHDLSHLKHLYDQLVINETYELHSSVHPLLQAKFDDFKQFHLYPLTYVSQLKTHKQTINAKAIYFFDLDDVDLSKLSWMQRLMTIDIISLTSQTQALKHMIHLNLDQQLNSVVSQLLQSHLEEQLVIVPDQHYYDTVLRYFERIDLPYQTSQTLYLKDDPLGNSLKQSLSSVDDHYYEGQFHDVAQWIALIQQPKYVLNQVQQLLLNQVVEEAYKLESMPQPLLIQCLTYIIDLAKTSFKGYVGGVHVVLQDAIPTKQFSCVYVLGFNHGMYPMKPSVEGLLSQEEYEWLQDEGHILPFGIQQGEALEKRFEQHLKNSSNQIILCALKQDDMTQPLLMHEWIQRGISSVCLSNDEHLVTTTRLRQIETIKTLPNITNQPVLNASSIQLLSKTITRNSVTQIETYTKCPYKYFIHYHLKPKMKVKNQESISIGIIVHELLKQLISKPYDVSLIDQAWQRMLQDDQYKDHLSIFSTSTLNHIYRMLNHSFKMISMQKEAGSFEVRDVEYEIKTIIQGHPFKGIIDRIDLIQQGDCMYVFIIDYKTGNKKVQLDRVYEGLDLQLFIYLKMLLDELTSHGYQVRIGGLYYYHVYSPIITKLPVQKMYLNAYGYAGYTLENTALIQTIQSNQEIKIIDGGVKKDGELKRGKYLTEQQFDLLLEHIVTKVSETMAIMNEGSIVIEPLQQDNELVCSMCDYRLICMRDTHFNPTRDIPKRSTETILNLLEGENEDE